MTKTIFIGDSHSNWSSFHEIVREARARYTDAQEIVSVGDFGCYPALTSFRNETGLPVRFIDGNHEDHPAIRNGSYRKQFEADWIPRGTLEGDVLFCGGADSIDRKQQEARGTWHVEEAVTQADVEACLSSAGSSQVNLVVAHDMPDLGYTKNGIMPFRGAVSAMKLQTVLSAVKPKFWVHGHHHASMLTRLNETWCLGLHATHFPDSSEGTSTAFWDGRRLFVGGNELSGFDFTF